MAPARGAINHNSYASKIRQLRCEQANESLREIRQDLRGQSKGSAAATSFQAGAVNIQIAARPFSETAAQIRTRSAPQM